MSIKCTHCGYDSNRDQDRFCRQCGKSLQSQMPSHSLTPPRQQAGPLQPQHAPSQPAMPTTSQPVWLQWLPWTRPAGPLVTGTVTVSKERRDRPPRDWYRMLFIGSLVLLFSPLIALVMVVAIAMSVAVSIFFSLFPSSLRPSLGPVGSTAFTFVAWQTLVSLFRPSSDSPEVPVYELSVEDVLTGRVVNVEMIGRRTGGSIEVGDDVEVYGEWTDKAVQSNIRAWEIHITQRYSPAQGRKVSSGAVVKAKRPFPPVVAIATFLLAIIAVLFICSGLGTIEAR